MSWFLRKLPDFALALVLIATAEADERWAPHAVAGPVDQLSVAGNACGPAALLASFRCGSEKWRAVPEKIPGTSDRAKLLYIIRAHGLRPSASLRDRKRWTGNGINAEDLADVAAELSAIGGMPEPRTESLLARDREKPAKLVDRLHDRLRDSLVHGLPPVLSLRRYVFRDGSWQAVQGHFVTVVMVPEKLGRGDESFSFTYFDPWGGKKLVGTFRVPTVPVLSTDGKHSPCLEAVVASSGIGKTKVRANERTVVIPTVVTGRW